MKTSLKNGLGVLWEFSPLYQVTQLLESEEVRLELRRGDRVRVQREIVKFIPLPFPFSSQLKIWSFHVVVVLERQIKVLKKAMHVQSYCFPQQLLFFKRSRCRRRRRRSFVRSLLSAGSATKNCKFLTPSSV